MNREQYWNQLAQRQLRDTGYLDIKDPKGRPGPLTEAAFQTYLVEAGLAEKPEFKTGTFADLVATLAHKEVGVKEVGGNNRGPRIVEYQEATWLQPGPWAWCAAFVCWCVQRAADRITVDFTLPQTAGAWDFERWASGLYGPVDGVQLIKPHAGRVLRGDIIVFTYSHIGIAVADSHDGRVHDVEGNTNPGGSREGDGVFERRPQLRVIRSLIRFNP